MLPSAGGPNAAADATPEEEQGEEQQQQEGEEEEEGEEVGPKANKQGVYPKTYKNEVSHCTLEFLCF